MDVVTQATGYELFWQETLEELPVLLKVEKLFEKKIDFTETLIVCVQHLVRTSLHLFQALFRMGLKPENLYVIGKCYSTSPIVYDKFIKENIQVSPISIKFDSYTAFDTLFDENLDLFTSKFILETDFNEFEKIIVLDDGGHLINKLSNKGLDYSKFIAIEQTSSGYNRLKNKKLPFPVINLARAWVKLEYESPIILNTVQQSLSKYLTNRLRDCNNILILGGGTLGSRIANMFFSQFKTIIFDQQPSKSDIGSDEFETEIAKADLIIGATGETSITKEMHKFLKQGVILASISSSDREFYAHFLRRQTFKTNNCHDNLEIDGITLLNCGFPVNFGSDYNVVDNNHFQLTRALILTACIQAFLLKNQVKGWVGLDESLQNIIALEYEQYRKKEGFLCQNK